MDSDSGPLLLLQLHNIHEQPLSNGWNRGGNRFAVAVLVRSFFLCLLFSLSATAAEKGWIEVRSPHFRVLSDGAEHEARTVAGRFEQMRMAFATALPWLRLDPPVPLLILAPRDETSLKTLLPEMWK